MNDEFSEQVFSRQHQGFLALGFQHPEESGSSFPTRTIMRGCSDYPRAGRFGLLQTENIASKTPNKPPSLRRFEDSIVVVGEMKTKVDI